MAKYEIEDWQTEFDKAKTKAEQRKAVEDYSVAKSRNAALREEERLNKRTTFDKFLDAIFRVKEKKAKAPKKEKAMAQKEQHSR